MTVSGILDPIGGATLRSALEPLAKKSGKDDDRCRERRLADALVEVAHHAMDHDLTLKAAALQLKFVTEAEFDRIVDPKKMVSPYVASET